MTFHIGVAAASLSLLAVGQLQAQPRAMTHYYLGDITGNEEKDTITGSVRPSLEPEPAMTAGEASYVGLQSGEAEKDTFALRPRPSATPTATLQSEAK